MCISAQPQKLLYLANFIPENIQIVLGFPKMHVITHKTQDSALESSEKAACLSHFKILSKQ